ncbi:MAG: PAS domain S-box protein [Mesorhizobium sp.]|uniref:sensor histidine kinase n=1 Tax=Mesorhizobium sp. TaxID=1871066 RepID=UPI000FEA9015|nr:HWE histidine kinase domain-containing protein [Mesorhizobium sp.]RWB79081.1 MAG: PAS domain S-box protein [Mesorhizobium sp.]RWL84316.1 MAG: PAS domain S-box protein [Mesorhizobium sp.]RWL88796.1 MAG: PAS domain S-box protein [Mesorhizobium sp.]RWM03329.1 MAG: PAS domain S-box protein [Mesorhizobium sp.]TIP06046.1 MAG: PAS domain S-box protein [Mesorhizobium sp.]
MSKGPPNKPLEPGLADVKTALRGHARAEARLRESDETLRDFAEAASDVLWARNADTLQWEYLTPVFEAIYGMSREQALAGDNFATWIDLVVPEDREHVLGQIARIRDGEGATFQYRICRPADNEIRWLRDSGFPMRDEAGKVAHIGGVGQDITREKQAEEQQQARFAELQHHMRNTLAVIRSIVRRTMEKSESLDEAAAHLEGRINAFARVQAAITRHPSIEINLASIVAEELRAAGGREGDNLTIEGPPLALAPKAAETMGLAIHELATNALKYGALASSSRTGRIDIKWRLEEDLLRFVWAESGVDDLKQTALRGFGFEVLERTLPYELGATVELRFAPSGLNFTAAVPLRAIRAIPEKV